MSDTIVNQRRKSIQAQIEAFKPKKDSVKSITDIAKEAVRKQVISVKIPTPLELMEERKKKVSKWQV